MATITRYHVPAGTYHVAEKGPILLQAFLGTCVAVSLYCKQTRTGGLIHLLLPGPVSSSPVIHPEKYAASGLPLILQTMRSRGARCDQLIATVAGGALIGPLTQQDLDLDIGGHTAEIARQILTREGVEIIQSETGGFFTCCLNLDLHNGESIIVWDGRPTACRN